MHRPRRGPTIADRFAIVHADRRYAYTADNSRVTKTAVATAGGADQLTRYLGPEAEIEPSGVWVKYLHDDVKRVLAMHASGMTATAPRPRRSSITATT